MRRTPETCSPLPILQHITYNVLLPKPTLSENMIKKLHQVADIDTLMGFKGNYMIFPLTDFDNYMTWYLIHNYVDFDASGCVPVGSRPRPADIDPATLEAAMAGIKRKGAGDLRGGTKTGSWTVMVQLLSNETEQMVIVPSDQLYIEALPGTHPILEDFKLMHRALNVKKVQAEVAGTRSWRTCAWLHVSRMVSTAIRTWRRRSWLSVACRSR